MPARTRPKPNAAAPDPLARLSAAMGRLQHDAETLLKQTRGRARSLLNRERRSLLGQAQQLRNALQRQARRTTRDLERRADQVRAALGSEVTKRMRALVQRLDLPSRNEMQRLSRRVNNLEQAVKRQPRRGAARKS
jgi:DNA anti-recombination protein RmuC